MEISDVSKISPKEAQAKMHQGVTLLDVREYPEWVESHVLGATLIPLGDLKGRPEKFAREDEVILLCKSGGRSTEAAQCLTDAGVTNALVIEGGIAAWKEAGLPTQHSQGGPISIERQVRIGAGLLVLLGLFVPRLRVVSYFVPCGLIFAGVTDWCGMAKVLSKMPWNRAPDDASPAYYSNVPDGAK